jgi:hypothetical protein
MSDDDSALSKSQLKKTVATIILSQGNDFIKDLLRTNGIKIGATKKDFAENINDAIDAEQLTQTMIEAWLDEIEGWGNQHVYLFEPPSVDVATLGALLADSEHAELVGQRQSYTFPDELSLSNIAHSTYSLSLIWHLGKEGWDRAKSKDFQKTEGLELYRYDAYRQRMDRSIVRFDWQFADAYCAILIHRNKDIDHDQAIGVVWETLKALKVVTNSCFRLSLSQAVKSKSKKQGTKQARLEADGGYVNLVSTLQEGGIDQVEAVRQTRHAMNDSKFSRAQGMFVLGAEETLEAPMSVQVYGSEGRLRLWAQCKRDDVYAIIRHLMDHNVGGAGA